MAKKPAPATKAAAKKVVKPAKKEAQVIKPATKSAKQQPGRETNAKLTTGLNTNEERFVQEYLADPHLNATQAYLRVFPHVTNGSARVQSCRLLAHPNIQAAILKAKQERADRTKITLDEALRHVWGVATADVREIVEYRVGCCRHCWGKDNLYQRTAGEFERDEAALAKKNEELIEAGKPGVQEFDPKGGIGYDKRLDPNPDCPECFGEGVGRTVFHDTSNLSPGAAALFAGVKETKEGIEIKVHSKNEALDKVMRHLGGYEKDNKQRGSMFEGVPRDFLKAVAERLSGKGG